MRTRNRTVVRLIEAEPRAGRFSGRRRRVVWWHRVFHPRVYLRLAMVVASALLLGLPLAGNGVTAALTPAATSGCRVVSVVDGDTVRMWCPSRGVERARLVGFDTPEKFSPRCGSEYARAVAATWQLRRVLAGASRIALAREGTDRYGRALVRAWVDGAPVARRMIALGNARPYGGGRRVGWCG